MREVLSRVGHKKLNDAFASLLHFIVDGQRLECIMSVSMEDLCGDLDNVLMEAIAL